MIDLPNRPHCVVCSAPALEGMETCGRPSCLVTGKQIDDALIAGLERLTDEFERCSVPKTVESCVLMTSLASELWIARGDDKEAFLRMTRIAETMAVMGAPDPDLSTIKPAAYGRFISEAVALLKHPNVTTRVRILWALKRSGVGVSNPLAPLYVFVVAMSLLHEVHMPHALMVGIAGAVFDHAANEARKMN
jgi:hypothetical protein